MSRAGQVVLSTSRLRLVPLGDEHLAGETELDADPEVMRYLGNGRARTPEQVQESHRYRVAEADLVPGLGFWAGLVDGEFAGWWILGPPLDEEGALTGGAINGGATNGGATNGGEAELGYRLLRRHWRQGYASEGARELLRHGFEDLGLRRVHATTMAVNAASRATMASVGLRYIRTFHQHFDEPIAGVEHGEVEYALTRGEWAAALSRSTR